MRGKQTMNHKRKARNLPSFLPPPPLKLRARRLPLPSRLPYLPPSAPPRPANGNAYVAALPSRRSPPAIPPTPRPQSPCARCRQRETETNPPPVACTRSPSHPGPSTESSAGRLAGYKTPADVRRRGYSQSRVPPSSKARRRSAACRRLPCTDTPSPRPENSAPSVLQGGQYRPQRCLIHPLVDV